MKEKKLNQNEEMFCKFYASDEEFFGNGVKSYMKSYPESSYETAKSNAYKLLTKEYILNRINEIMEEGILNDVFVDKQLSFLINQNADLPTKIKAISEYNKLKSRITEKKELFGKDGESIKVSWE